MDSWKGKSVVNLGSSTAEFRKKIQPHIQQAVISPLEHEGALITHVDVKYAEGVDVSANLTTPEFPKLLGQQYDLVLCTNMLEHITDLALAAQNIVDITNDCGFILLTVPKRYPLHFDPIDNGFRPTPKELANLILRNTSGYLLKGEIISIKDKYYYPVKKSKYPLWGYRSRIKYWIGYYYQTTGVLIRKTK